MWIKTSKTPIKNTRIRTCSLIVIPLSRSRSMLSRNCSFISRFCTVPVICSNLSAKVDFPWSIWAIMQKFLIFDIGTCMLNNKGAFNETPFSEKQNHNKVKCQVPDIQASYPGWSDRTTSYLLMVGYLTCQSVSLIILSYKVIPTHNSVWLPIKGW